MDNPPYKCKKCKLGAMVLDGQVVKFCKCKAPVVLNMESAILAKGGIKG